MKDRDERILTHWENAYELNETIANLAYAECYCATDYPCGVCQASQWVYEQTGDESYKRDFVNQKAAS